MNKHETNHLQAMIKEISNGRGREGTGEYREGTKLKARRLGHDQEIVETLFFEIGLSAGTIYLPRTLDASIFFPSRA